MKKTVPFFLFFGLWLLASVPAFAEAIPGDVNGDKQLDIADAILSLKILNHSSSGQTPDANAAVNPDGRIGMAETLYILQGIAGQRALPLVFETRVAAGQITLPAGTPAGITELTVLNAGGETHPNAEGTFSVDCLDGGASLNTVLSPAGNVMLLGWLDGSHQTLNARTTAEVMLFFALGADRYGTDERENLRWLLELAPEVAPLASAISTELAANADALAGENAVVTAAMTSVIEAMSAAAAAERGGRQPLSVSIEPPGEQSGVTLLMEGVNGIRLSNAFRRRLKVWIDQIAYVPSGGGAWVESRLPLTEFEVDPVTGLKSVLATVTDWFADKSAYCPVKSRTVSLPVMPKSAEKTAYEVIVCGNGFSDGEIATLPADRLTDYGANAVKFLFFDVVLPAVVNIIAPQASVPEILKKIDLGKADIAMFLKGIQSTPGVMNQISQGDYGAVITTIRTSMTDAYKKEILEEILKVMVLSDRVPTDVAERSEKIIGRFMDGMKIFNAALTAVDIAAIRAHDLLSKKMETWRVEVSHPKVVLKPEKAVVIPEGTQTFSATLPEATGDGAPALTYHWRSSGVYGSITDGIHTGTEFDSSRSSVDYTGAAVGTDTVEVEAFDTQGPERISVGGGTATVEVAEAKVSVQKEIYDVAQGKTVILRAILEPAPAAGDDIWYGWASACNFGRFNGSNPFRDKSNQLAYVAGSTLEGEDIVTLTAYKVVGGWQTGTWTALSQAQTRVRVWASPKKSPMSVHTYGPRIVSHSYQAPGEPVRNRWLIYGWADSWPTPEGMHNSGSPTVPTTVNISLPLRSHYFDEAYKMGIDLREEMGIPDDVNFDMRVAAEPIGPNPDFYGLKSMIEEANRLVNGKKASWERTPKPYNIDCTP